MLITIYYSHISARLQFTVLKIVNSGQSKCVMFVIGVISIRWFVFMAAIYQHEGYRP